MFFKRIIYKFLNLIYRFIFSLKDDQPTWYPEEIDEIKENGKWKFMGRTEHIVSCHFQGK